MSPDLTNEFTYTNQGSQPFFVIETLKKGSHPMKQHIVEFPAIPELNIAKETVTVTRFSGTVSQRTYFGTHAELTAHGWRVMGAGAAYTPRACRADGPEDYLRSIEDLIANRRLGLLEEEKRQKARDAEESVDRAVTSAVRAALVGAKLVAEGQDTRGLPRFSSRYHKQGVNLSRPEELAEVLQTANIEKQVYTLAAKFILAKADPRDLEALSKAGEASTGVQRVAAVNDEEREVIRLNSGALAKKAMASITTSEVSQVNEPGVVGV